MTSETISNTGGSSESRTRFGTALTIDTELITEFRPTELTSLSDRKPEHKSDLLSPDQRDQNSLAIPDLSLSVGKVSDDIHMIEPVTPLTDLFTLDSIATSKGGRTPTTSPPSSFDEADSLDEGLLCEVYANKPDLHNTTPFSHDLQVMQAHCESVMIEETDAEVSLPASTPSSTDAAPPCAESSLPSSASSDARHSESHSPLKLDEAAASPDILQKKPLKTSSSKITPPFTCAQCHLPFPTRGKVK